MQLEMPRVLEGHHNFTTLLNVKVNCNYIPLIHSVSLSLVYKCVIRFTISEISKVDIKQTVVCWRACLMKFQRVHAVNVITSSRLPCMSYPKVSIR